MNFEVPLKDYVRAVQSIKATIGERANALRQQCELAETMKLKEINLDKLMLTRSDRVGEAEHEYKEASHPIQAFTLCLFRPLLLLPPLTISFICCI
ncbi:sorting nexin 1-like [Hibiscus syriacus]|uniref:sorting nexin 1-like n=1 Tax=Hibiscus syriacus TaxID=106335 RepID=UPI001924B66E|nr:sorting nexin 1-like [Hibiscus syriacus]